VQLPKDAKELNIGLSRDGKTFYTYENNILIHWSTNPIQILDSVKITDPMFPSPLNFDFTPDGKKMVFSHGSHGIGLFDLEKKQFTKKLATRFVGDTLIGSDIFTFDELGILEKIDLNSFKATIVKHIPKIETNSEDYVDYPIGLFRSKDGKSIVAISSMNLNVYNVQTFEQLKYIETLFMGMSALLVSVNHQIIAGNTIKYDVNTRKETVFTGDEQKKMRQGHKLVHKQTLNFYESKYWYNQYIDRIYDDGSINVLNWLDDQKLYQFTGDDWLTITASGYFNGSSESHKYLYMKTTSGESVPIDDVTYNKFHKQINLKD
jgi:hypothetical protein